MARNFLPVVSLAGMRMDDCLLPILRSDEDVQAKAFPVTHFLFRPNLVSTHCPSATDD